MRKEVHRFLLWLRFNSEYFSVCKANEMNKNGDLRIDIWIALAMTHRMNLWEIFQHQSRLCSPTMPTFWIYAEGKKSYVTTKNVCECDTYLRWLGMLNADIQEYIFYLPWTFRSECCIDCVIDVIFSYPYVFGVCVCTAIVNFHKIVYLES